MDSKKAEEEILFELRDHLRTVHKIFSDTMDMPQARLSHYREHSGGAENGHHSHLAELEPTAPKTERYYCPADKQVHDEPDGCGYPERHGWAMPVWMEPYRHLIKNTGGTPVEELVWDLENKASKLAFTNVIRLEIAMMVNVQVELLKGLHVADVLK